MGNFLPRVSNKRKLDSSDESVAKKERTGIVSPSEKVEMQIDDTNAEIKGIEKEIKGVGKEIKGIEKKLENPMKTWEGMAKKGQDLVYANVKDWASQLRDKEKELRDEKNKLRDKENKLRDTLNKLLDEKKQLRDKEKIPTTKSLSDEDAVTFSVRNSSDFSPKAYFKYVKDPRLSGLVEHVKDLQNGPDATFFKYPVIDGGTGVGKTRLGLEVMGRLTDTLCLFVNLTDLAKTEYADEKGDHAYKCVADLIFRRLVPRSMREENEYRYTLDEVLDKVARDLGKFKIVLQIDEYAANFPIVRAVIRVCDNLYHKPHRSQGKTMRIIPILTGIPIVGARKKMLKVSNKAQPMFVTLSGVADVGKLQANFRKELSINENVRYLEIILDTFGGVPRLYDDLRALLVKAGNEVLLARLRTGKLDLEHAKRLYLMVREQHLRQYGLETWESYFSSSPDRVRVARGALRRIHTLAITGETTNKRNCVVKGHPATFDELSSLGLFTYVLDQQNQTEGTISVPLLTVDAYVQWTEICPPTVLSPFAYAWESMEYVAMLSLVCRWNSIWFANSEKPKRVPLSQLRPGAYTKPGGLDSKTVEVNCELPQLVQLAMDLSGDHTTEFPTNADGRGDKKKITDRSAYLLTPGQAGNDGLAVFTPYMWLNQTKSADLICANTKNNPPSTITQGVVDELVERQRKHFALSLHGITDVVCDIFTNRTRGTKLDDTKLPDNTFVTTRENFAEVVGPVFAHTIDLITWNIKKKRVDRKARTS